MSRSRPRGAALAVALVLGGAGCAVGPDYERPELALRDAYLEADGAASRPESRPEEAASRPAPWWTSFGDPTLVACVEAAARSSFDLRIASARVEEVFALRGVARAALFPAVDATAGAERRRESGNSLFFSEPLAYGRYRAGLESSWEIDLFGRVKRQIEAAEADAGAADETLADVVRLVVGQTVEEYFNYRGARREAETTARNAEAQRGVVELTERLASSGIGVEADVARAKALLRETESALPALEARATASLHRLATLIGEDAAVTRARLAADASPAAPPTPDPGVPSDILRARPDVRAAERELAAATARIGVATADLFPRLTLTGLFGLESTEPATLFQGDSVSFGVGPSIRWPALDYGATRDRIAAAGARQSAALARYEQTVARAVAEVESALAAARGRRLTLASLAEALAHTREALRLVEERHRVGATSFLDVLDARRRALAVETDFVRTETALLLDLAALRRALGSSG